MQRLSLDFATFYARFRIASASLYAIVHLSFSLCMRVTYHTYLAGCAWLTLLAYAVDWNGPVEGSEEGIMALPATVTDMLYLLCKYWQQILLAGSRICLCNWDLCCGHCGLAYPSIYSMLHIMRDRDTYDN